MDSLKRKKMYLGCINIMGEFLTCGVTDVRYYTKIYCKQVCETPLALEDGSGRESQWRH